MGFAGKCRLRPAGTKRHPPATGCAAAVCAAMPPAIVQQRAFCFPIPPALCKGAHCASANLWKEPIAYLWACAGNAGDAGYPRETEERPGCAMRAPLQGFGRSPSSLPDKRFLSRLHPLASGRLSAFAPEIRVSCGTHWVFRACGLQASLLGG